MPVPPPSQYQIIQYIPFKEPLLAIDVEDDAVRFTEIAGRVLYYEADSKVGFISSCFIREVNADLVLNETHQIYDTHDGVIKKSDRQLFECLLMQEIEGNAHAYTNVDDDEEFLKEVITENIIPHLYPEDVLGLVDFMGFIPRKTQPMTIKMDDAPKRKHKIKDNDGN